MRLGCICGRACVCSLLDSYLLQNIHRHTARVAIKLDTYYKWGGASAASKPISYVCVKVYLMLKMLKYFWGKQRDVYGSI